VSYNCRACGLQTRDAFRISRPTYDILVCPICFRRLHICVEGARDGQRCRKPSTRFGRCDEHADALDAELERTANAIDQLKN
jgi:hypothetical protein